MIHRLNALSLSVVVCFGVTLSLFAERPASVTMKDRETQKHIDAQRSTGFSDNEIDTLHGTVGEHLRKMKKLQDLGVDKTAAQYLAQTPTDVKPLYKKDDAGKPYLEIKLPQGQSYIDWPRIYLYDGTAFVYPKEDFSDLDKIILAFRRVNADGTIYVKEMRRLINPSPRSQSPDKDEKGEAKIDTNSDIILEYFQALNSDTIWPNTPTQKDPANITMVLNDEKDPLPYEKQKHIMLTYKKMLRKISKHTAHKLRDMELDQRQLITKILDYN
ncbi:LIC13212 family protein [Leptospira sp. 'Mane']|uniref:LIC13212 family protein n=1 Tax=Leptospira sp. 'Mane' TaxID=3387407 RepID=UPI00398BB9DF